MNVGRYLRGEDNHVGTARITQPKPPSPEEQHVRAVLTEAFGPGCVGETNILSNIAGEYLHWNPSNREVSLDGVYSAIELAAIAWWMMHKEKKDGSSNTPAGGTHQA